MQLGYREIHHERIEKIKCQLTSGSIIMFNDRKCLVTWAGSDRYIHKGKTCIAWSEGWSGFLKDIETGKEFRANWETLTTDKIIWYEDWRKKYNLTY